ncbi:Protein of uncharacterised function (DUF3375) [Klebsiella pneumoniae]|uniref:Protein of uncharacterized function (DUF3375) n=1 Tax=Klebsiella pneumoniae TaxID=573 RepID=A0A378BPU1_KLEPN|nr:Protein of uncharacterised function (DUF3375) [Klebsiella pneumoniae]STU53475.1 Protein of uncharacterised function (DUF3375) [Klebsiella pneumoniae]STV49570.1 Protein of uncharacterised function (DUF3375) [Klebsiella pneumoniae]
MEENTRQRTENYISAKNQHPAWILLASRRAPLVLSCLKTLFEKAHDGIPLEDAIQSLSGILIEGNDSNLLIVFYVQIMPDDLVMQLHRF